MPSQPKKWYREEAARRYHRSREQNLAESTIEIDGEAAVSMGTELPGAWVHAWIWIPDPAPPRATIDDSESGNL